MKRSHFGTIYSLDVLAALLVVSGFGVSDIARAGSNAAPVEKPKSQHEIQTQIGFSNAQIQTLEQQRKQAISGARTKAPVFEEGIGLFKKYDTLVRARYVDEDGEFQPALEIARIDSDNINRLFRTYLHWLPLKGRVSAGKARKTLATGVERLKDWSSEFGSADEENNSDVQILSKRIDDEKANIEQLSDLADSLGYKVDQKAIASSIAPPTAPAEIKHRTPASAPKKP